MQTVLVTGGANRLGRHIVQHLAATGNFNIIIHYNTSKQTALELQETLPNTTLWQCDLIQHNIAPPPCDILINNAAIFQNDNIKNYSDTSFQNHMQINCMAPIKLVQSLLQQHCLKQVINILDAKVKRQSPQFLSYSLSKASLAAFTEIAALELAPDIRVNAIAPGPVIAAPTQRDVHFENMQQNTPLKASSAQKIQDILSAISYLITAKSVTGQTLFVDAGATVGNGGLTTVI